MMDAEYLPIFNDEQEDALIVEIYEHVKKGTLSKLGQNGVSREIIEKVDDNGELIFYDIRYAPEKRPVKLGTMRSRVGDIVRNWKKYIAPLMTPELLEAAYQQVKIAGKSPGAFKAAVDFVLPKGGGIDETKPALSSGAVAILQQNPVGTTIQLGQNPSPQRAGDKGHECIDTVHSVADGQRQDVIVETVSYRDGEIVRRVYEGGDTAQGSALSDTSLSSEDPVDNNGGDGLDTPE